MGKYTNSCPAEGMETANVSDKIRWKLILQNIGKNQFREKLLSTLLIPLYRHTICNLSDVVFPSLLNIGDR